MVVKSLEFHEAAVTDYDQAFAWYLGKSPNAALHLDEEITRALTNIVDGPKRWTPGTIWHAALSVAAISISPDISGEISQQD